MPLRIRITRDLSVINVLEVHALDKKLFEYKPEVFDAWR